MGFDLTSEKRYDALFGNDVIIYTCIRALVRSERDDAEVSIKHDEGKNATDSFLYHETTVKMTMLQ